jgi:hypothetical protein
VLLPAGRAAAVGKGAAVLRGSPFLRRAFEVSAAEHGLCHGMSHKTPLEPYAPAPSDLEVFVLQTDKAARKWAANAQLEAALRASFRQCVPAAKKRRAPGGADDKEEEDDEDEEEDDEEGGQRGGGKGKGGRGKGGGRDSGAKGGAVKHDAATEAQLDKWVGLKRKRDFEAADALQAELRLKGVDTDASRPARQKAKPAAAPKSTKAKSPQNAGKPSPAKRQKV